MTPLIPTFCIWSWLDGTRFLKQSHDSDIWMANPRFSMNIWRSCGDCFTMSSSGTQRHPQTTSYPTALLLDYIMAHGTKWSPGLHKINMAIEAMAHRNKWFTYMNHGDLFNNYVSLPEGICCSLDIWINITWHIYVGKIAKTSHLYIKKTQLL